MWKKLLKYRNIAKSFVKVEIRSGELTSFCHDSWTEWGSLIELTKRRGCIDIGIPFISTVEQALETHQRRRHRADALNHIEQLLDEQISKGRLKGVM